MSPDLLPCPFCGMQPLVFTVGVDGIPPFEIGCRGPRCGVRPHCVGETMEHAANRWNTRAPAVFHADWTPQQILDHAG